MYKMTDFSLRQDLCDSIAVSTVVKSRFTTTPRGKGVHDGEFELIIR